MIINSTYQNNINNNAQPIIQSRNEWIGEKDKRIKILDEKYEKINEQNKKFADPHAHIFDKYRNPYSPYFRSDLSKNEREAAYRMEIGWANSGTGGQYNFHDAAFRNVQPYDPNEESIEKKLYNRQQVNNQINALLANNGVTLPINTDFTITIEPNNFSLKISDLEDEMLTNQIESILNSGNNAKELFYHILKSRSDDSTQFSKQKLDKFYLVNHIKSVTGYNLKDLAIENNTCVTKGICLLSHDMTYIASRRSYHSCIVIKRARFLLNHVEITFPLTTRRLM